MKQLELPIYCPQVQPQSQQRQRQRQQQQQRQSSTSSSLSTSQQAQHPFSHNSKYRFRCRCAYNRSARYTPMTAAAAAAFTSMILVACRCSRMLVFPFVLSTTPSPTPTTITTTRATTAIAFLTGTTTSSRRGFRTSFSSTSLFLSSSTSTKNVNFVTQPQQQQTTQFHSLNHPLVWIKTTRTATTTKLLSVSTTSSSSTEGEISQPEPTTITTVGEESIRESVDGNEPNANKDRNLNSTGGGTNSGSGGSGGGSGSGGRVSNAVRDTKIVQKTGANAETLAVAVAATEPISLQPPKGTRDFYPEDMKIRTWLFQQWRTVAKLYGFVEYDAPILESEALYTRKAGEEVTQQLYNFIDKGERNVALRPEMTPSLARMVLARKGALPLPLKWYSIPQCWRYERMTRGRRREHYQWNMDVWGIPTVHAEVELIRSMIHFFTSVGLTSKDVGIKVNSRLVIGEVLDQLGIPDNKFAATCVLIDKLEKVPIDDIQDDLTNLGLDRDVVERLLSILTNKSIDSLCTALDSMRSGTAVAESDSGPSPVSSAVDDDDDDDTTTGESGPTSSSSSSSPAVHQLRSFLKLCTEYKIDDWIVFDASIVRGLAYYTGIVFEAFDRTGTLRAIAGGGRYDKLLQSFGVTDPKELIPAVGFGFGDAVIIELLNERNLLPSFEKESGIDIVLYSMSNELYHVGLDIATTIRNAGRSVDIVLDSETKRTKWVLKHTDRVGAKYCFIIGTTEYSTGHVAVKNLATGEQTLIPIDSISEWVNNIATW